MGRLLCYIDRPARARRRTCVGDCRPGALAVGPRLSPRSLTAGLRATSAGPLGITYEVRIWMLCASYSGIGKPYPLVHSRRCALWPRRQCGAADRGEGGRSHHGTSSYAICRMIMRSGNARYSAESGFGDAGRVRPRTEGPVRSPSRKSCRRLACRPERRQCARPSPACRPRSVIDFSHCYTVALRLSAFATTSPALAGRIHACNGRRDCLVPHRGG